MGRARRLAASLWLLLPPEDKFRCCPALPSHLHRPELGEAVGSVLDQSEGGTVLVAHLANLGLPMLNSGYGFERPRALCEDVTVTEIFFFFFIRRLSTLEIACAQPE